MECNGGNALTLSLNGGHTATPLITPTGCRNLHYCSKDANGCVFSTTANINSSGGPTAVNVTPTDAACGQDNGSLSMEM
jgi:hypothetical protein